MATVKLILPETPPPPPERVELSLSYAEARALRIAIAAYHPIPDWVHDNKLLASIRYALDAEGLDYSAAAQAAAGPRAALAALEAEQD